MAARLLMRNKILKSELILKSLPKINNVSIYADQYLRAVRNIKDNVSYEEASELVHFPFKSFQNFPKSAVKNFIDESFNVMKEQGKAKNAFIYNRMMQSYMDYNITFDINDFLHKMTENQIRFNQGTYSNIIKFFCKHGEMATVEYFLEKIKSENISIRLIDKQEIISGYIISGHPNKSKTFIKENELNENSKDVLLSEAKGYATIGDVNNVTNILKKMEENELSCAPVYYCMFYRLLIQANVSESNLGTILDSLKSIAAKNFQTICLTINRLNYDGYFNNSAYLIEKFTDVTYDDKQAIFLIASFKKPGCPVNTYQKVLKLLMDRVDLVLSHINIFSYMNFDDAFEFGSSVINKRNGQVICTSLINKAIDDKSINSIEKSLRFTMNNLQWAQINFILQCTLIQFMIKSGMASNYREILDLLPKFKTCLLPVIFIQCLCKGDFDEFNRLRMEHEFVKMDSFRTNWRRLRMIVKQNICINKLAEEASKVFPNESVNNLIVEALHKKLMESSKSENLDEIQKLIEIGKSLHLTFRQKDVDHLVSILPEHAEYFKSSLFKSEKAEVKEES